MTWLWYVKSWIDWASYWVGAFEVYPVAAVILCAAVLMCVGLVVVFAGMVRDWLRLLFVSLGPIGRVTPRAPGVPVSPEINTQPPRVHTIGFAERPLRRVAPVAPPTPKQRVLDTLNTLSRKPYKRKRQRRPINED